MGDKFPKFKAAAVQASPVFLDREATVEKACKLMKEASDNGAKLVAFPETFVAGFPYWTFLDAPLSRNHFFVKMFEEGVEVPGPATEELCRGAREADVCVVIGINERQKNQMGTMFNTNIIIDNNGNLLGRHRKIVTTVSEKLVYSRGDGSGLRVWETDLGRIGTLICGNNTHNLYKYALLAQGEQVHVANYPSYHQPTHVDLPNWIRIRSGAHSLEGKLFTVTSSSTMNPEMVEMLSEGDEKKQQWLEACRCYSCIHDPIGNELAGAESEDTIIYADVDISEEIVPKQYHDILGQYTRMDVVSMNLCQDEDRPIYFVSRKKNQRVEAESVGGNMQGYLKELKQEIEEVKSLTEKLADKIGKDDV